MLLTAYREKGFEDHETKESPLPSTVFHVDLRKIELYVEEDRRDFTIFPKQIYHEWNCGIRGDIDDNSLPLETPD